MALTWADTFGGGNSFTESFANTFTQNDGASYVDGTLTYDSGSNAGQVVQQNSSGGYGGTNDDGNAVYSGSANNVSTNSQNISGSGNNSFTPSGMAPSGISAALGYLNPLGIIGKLAGWANNLDPSKDIKNGQVVGGQQVYDNGSGFVYSYNFAKMPYEVEIVDGKVVDKLSIKDEKTGLTGYQVLAQKARSEGDNDTADAIMAEAADNANAAEGGSSGSAISQDNILAMIKNSGVAQSNQEIAEMVANPKGYLDARGINLSDIIPNLDPATEGALLDPSNPAYSLSDLANYTPATISGVAPVNMPTEVTPVSYNAATMSDRMDNPQTTVDAATGEIRDQNLVNSENYTIDAEGAATGINADGTINRTGEALNDYASQKFSQVVDTRTVAGKLLAQNLGEGNYTDIKSTLTGQLEILADSFVDQNGNPKIPAFAQAQARVASRTMTFKGMTGTAATAAMATALMEASLPIAQQDAQFFQTLSLKNLDNRQQAIINRATVLSKFDLANLDAREAAAVQNAQAFLEIDMTNLTNEQQAEVINTQARVQALLEDTQQTNVQRRFSAETQNDFTKFYEEIGVQVESFNSQLVSDIKRFNAGEINDSTEFSLNMENQRQQFYAKMQYAVDESNAKWRQTVATQNTQMAFDAAATDVKNYLDLSQEGLNRMWDRTDATLDYLYKSAALEEEFELRLLLGEMQAAAATPAKKSFFDTLIGGAITIGAAYAGRSVG